VFDRQKVKNRIYNSGFVIDHFLFSFGGQTNGGKVLPEFLKINTEDFDFTFIQVENQHLLPTLT